MSQIIFFILGAVAGGALVWFVKKIPEKKRKESLIEKQAREKAANMESILELLALRQAQGKKHITNDEVQKELKISDATAERYLDELEKEGKVKQVGDTGSGVYYTSTGSTSSLKSSSVQAKKI